MNMSFKTVGFLSAFVGASACGGGGSPSVTEPTPAFSLASEDGSATIIGLDTSTSLVSETVGSWNNATQTVASNGQTLNATSDPINASNTYVRRVAAGTAGETLVYSATLAGDLPTGSAVYEGTASVVITDSGVGSASYTLTGDSTATVNFGDNGLDLSIDGLTGTKTASASGPQAFTSDGPITITDLALTSGAISADGDTVATITGIDSVAISGDVTTSAAGGIAGPAGEEVAGVAIVNDADTILITTFAGQD